MNAEKINELVKRAREIGHRPTYERPAEMRWNKEAREIIPDLAGALESLAAENAKMREAVKAELQAKVRELVAENARLKKIIDNQIAEYNENLAPQYQKRIDDLAALLAWVESHIRTVAINGREIQFEATMSNIEAEIEKEGE